VNRRLRVGLVCPYSFDARGGVQSHVVGLARFLTAAGHDVRLLAPGKLAADAGLQPDQFTSAGAAIPVPYNRSVARVNFGPASRARARRWLQHGNFDVIHIHEPITPSIALLALWDAQAPVVATFHTATPRSRTMELAAQVLRTVIAKVTVGIAVSEPARRVVRQHLRRDPTVIPNGFHFADFAEHSQRFRPGGSWRGGDHPRLSFLGRADEPRKGLSVLLDALPLIRARHPTLEVAVAGAGNARLPDGCRRLGALSDRAKVDLLNTTDVFVAPQLERESFGIVLLEAMASSAGVVASDLEPFLDLLQPGGAAPLGELFPRGNSRALADAALRVLAAPDEARRTRARIASRRYDWAVVGPEIMSIYGSVAGRYPVRLAQDPRFQPVVSHNCTGESMIEATRVRR
jgi:phosphatidyl-myo-inositol alpha-mannosyltransferase